MIHDFGTVRPGTTLYIPFHTFDSNDPSASVTMTGLAVTDIEIYKNGGTTQRASDSGYALLDTDGIDFDGVTGIHGFSLDLADNTTADFFTAGAQYWVVVSSITVDGGTINFVAATFRIGYEDAIVNTTIATLSTQTSFTLSAGSGDNDAYNGCIVCVHDVASAVQVAFGVISDYVGSTLTVTLAADPGIFTMAAGDNISIFPPANAQFIAAGVPSTVILGALTDDATQLDGSAINALSANDPGSQLAAQSDVTSLHNFDPDNDAVANVTLVDTTTTNTDMRGTDNAALASVLGALADAAADGDPTTGETVMQYVKQLINVLVGTAGVVTYPAAAAPGNAVSIAEIIRAMYDDTNELQADDIPGAISGLNNLSQAEAQAAAAAALVAIDLDHLINTAESDTPADNSIIAKLAASDGDWSSFVGSSDSLQSIRDVEPHGTAMRGTDSASTHSAADIWAVATRVLTANTNLNDPTAADIRAEIDSNSTQLALILTVLQGLILENGTIGSTGNDTTHVHLDGLTYGDDEINNYMLVIFDNSASEYHSRWIEDWADTGDLATVATLPFTPEDAVDSYWLLPIRQDVTGGSGLDAAGVRAAVGLAAANLDTQLDAIPTAVENRQEIDSNSTQLAAIVTDTGTTIPDQITGLENLSSSDVQVVIETNKLDHLAAVADSDDVADNSILAKMAAGDGDWSSFIPSTDALQAIRDVEPHGTTMRGTDNALTSADEPVSANVTQISGDATAADNAESFFDGTGYAGTNNTIPTVTDLTNPPSDSSGITTLLSRLSAARAGYLDNLSAGAVATLAKVRAYFQLALRKDSAIATDNSTEVTEINADGGSGAGAYDNTTEAQEAIRDQGDSAWATAVGFATHTAADIWAVATRVLTAGTNIVLAKGVGVTGFNDETKEDIADQVWDEAKSGHVGAGSFGEEVQAHALTSEIDALENLSQAEAQTAAAAALTAYDPPTRTEATSDKNEVLARLPASLVSGRMNSNVAAINDNATAAARLALSAASIVAGAAVSGTLSTTQMSTDLTEATNDHYQDAMIRWTSGVLAGQTSVIEAYNGTTKVLTFTAVTEPPGAGDTFILV